MRNNFGIISIVEATRWDLNDNLEIAKKLLKAAGNKNILL